MVNNEMRVCVSSRVEILQPAADSNSGTFFVLCGIRAHRHGAKRARKRSGCVKSGELHRRADFVLRIPGRDKAFPCGCRL